MLHLRGRIVSQATKQQFSFAGCLFDYLSIPKIENVRSSETLVNIYQTVRLHIPEDTTFHILRHENLKSNTVM
jgi:hypothetical protein